MVLAKGRSNRAHRRRDERKGGSGKTTTTISLAAVLAERGLRVPVVDLDPQASASLWIGRGREPGLYRAITDRADLRPYVLSTAVQGIDLIAASRELAAVDDRLE
jgi:chromosome partitioning protein